MSKHNSKNTLSFVGLALALMAAPVDALPTMRIAGIVAFALGFQVGDGPKVKSKKSYSELRKKLEKLLTVANEMKVQREAEEALAGEMTKDDKAKVLSLWAFADRGTAAGARSAIAAAGGADAGRVAAAPANAVKNYWQTPHSSAAGGLDFAEAEIIAAGALGVAAPAATTVKGHILANSTITADNISSFTKGNFDLAMTIADGAGFSPANSQEKDNKDTAKAYENLLKSTKTKDATELAVHRWKALDSSSVEKTYGIEEFTGGTIDAGDNAFWRRFEFKGEVEVTWPVMDEMLRLGLVGGLSGNLYKSVFKERGKDLTDTAMFAFRLGGVINITKWFEFCVLALTERHTVSKDKLTDDKDSEQRKAYDEISSVLSSTVSALDSDFGIERYLGTKDKKRTDYVEALKQLQKDVDGEKDPWSFSGWSWGIELRAAVPLWITENIALKLGLAWKLPLTAIKKDDRELKPSQVLSPYVGVVFAI